MCVCGGGRGHGGYVQLMGEHIDAPMLTVAHAHILCVALVFGVHCTAQALGRAMVMRMRLGMFDPPGAGNRTLYNIANPFFQCSQNLDRDMILLFLSDPSTFAAGGSQPKHGSNPE